MPMAAVAQMEAAVVRPRTLKPSLNITPAQRNPIPVMIPCAILVGPLLLSPNGMLGSPFHS
jgi:hypothetical protein